MFRVVQLSQLETRAGLETFQPNKRNTNLKPAFFFPPIFILLFQNVRSFFFLFVFKISIRLDADENIVLARYGNAPAVSNSNTVIVFRVRVSLVHFCFLPVGCEIRRSGLKLILFVIILLSSFRIRFDTNETDDGGEKSKKKKKNL